MKNLIQLWKNIVKNDNLDINIIDGHLTVNGISHSESQNLHVYYNFNSLFLNEQTQYLGNGKTVTRIWMNVKNVESFEINKRWSK
jgi:hypothetical protein